MAEENTVKDLKTLRELVRTKIQAKHENEAAVAAEMERRRSKRRQKEKSMYQHLFIDAPQPTDLTFWMTRVGDPPKLGVPEESKGIRVKTNKIELYEVNKYRWHALQSFTYWLKKDDTKHLDPGLMAASSCRCRLPYCNSCQKRWRKNTMKLT